MEGSLAAIFEQHHGSFIGFVQNLLQFWEGFGHRIIWTAITAQSSFNSLRAISMHTAKCTPEKVWHVDTVPQPLSFSWIESGDDDTTKDVRLAARGQDLVS